MPRLPPSLFHTAAQIHPLAPRLLPVCRSLASVRSELRWIAQHVLQSQSSHLVPPRLRLWQLVDLRATGLPLQYVLGSQPFGSLDIKCRKGVLIPRPETESWTLYLASLLSSSSSPSQGLRVLDLCTGTGCIPLLLSSSLSARNTPLSSVTGVDISPRAISLAQENLAHNLRLGTLLPSTGSKIQFLQHDVFSPDFVSTLGKEEVDVLVSNPPYISHRGFATDTARSVRNYEPKLALVPSPEKQALSSTEHPEDVFYARILHLAQQLESPNKVVLEVASLEQATRVVDMVHSSPELLREYKTIEIWRDEPAYGGGVIPHRIEGINITVSVRGEGNGRAVYLSRD
ncbi:S-adenosyl-L-methionine-dependent methyltransferase [Podospora australis]|uniref:peptide chain release factor N(5)-glutamine methyltransferase n=1 Tax=Podospora australis TaxID=1536484 RepID=A0AAN7ALA4_9PEZI|nr:S-adenosyl-L-methionine-dependent methyltransferase [Podospora australis]